MTIGHTYELLKAGDWACAWGEPATLAAISLELATVLAPHLAPDADAIAVRTVSDFEDATRLWARLAGRLDHGLRIDADGRVGPAHRAGGGVGLRFRELMTERLLMTMEA